MRALTLQLRNDPGGASLTVPRLDRLLAALAGAADADVVLLEGGPGSFCEGLDLQSPLDPDLMRAGLERLATLLAALQACPRPVIAMVDGAALGGGLGLAAAADLLLATSRARFGLPETVMGLIPAVIFPVVAARVGIPRARLLALGTPALPAAEAYRWGLVDEVVDDMRTAVERHVSRFRRMDPAAQGALKRVVAKHFGPSSAYRAQAIEAFASLAGSPATSARLRRFADGLSPWPEEGR